MLLAAKGAPTVIAFEHWSINRWICDGDDVLAIGRRVCPLVAGLFRLCHYAFILLMN